jgi:lysophospholipase L1-like esterase
MGRSLLVICGIVLGLLLAEAVLRLGGLFYYQAWMRQESEVLRQQEEYEFKKREEEIKVSPAHRTRLRVLCLGDSWTFGQGAGPGYSYPAQLQSRLDKDSPGRYQVYNLGVPGNTSGMLLKYLSRHLKRYKPHVVVILIGMNDFHNPWVSQLYDLRDNPSGLGSFLTNLRLYKLSWLGLAELRRRLASCRRRGSDIKRQIDARSIQESNRYAQEGFRLSVAGRIDPAQQSLKRALELNPANEMALVHLGHLNLMTGKVAAGLNNYERLLELNPYTECRGLIFRDLFLIYQHRGAYKDRIEQLIKRIPSDKYFQNPGPFILNPRKMAGILRENLEEALNLIKSQAATPVLQTYYAKPGPGPNGIIRAVSARLGIVLVDNYRVFKAMPDSSTYFVEDGHPNQAGYRLIAEGVYRALKELAPKAGKRR